jgi:hypothetical protein
MRRTLRSVVLALQLRHHDVQGRWRPLPARLHNVAQQPAGLLQGRKPAWSKTHPI